MKLKSQFYTPGEKPPYYGLADDNWLIEVLIKDVKGNLMLGLTNRNDEEYMAFFPIGEEAFGKLPFDELVKLIKMDSDGPGGDWEDTDLNDNEELQLFKKGIAMELESLEVFKKDLRTRYGIESFGDGLVYTDEVDAGPVPHIHQKYYVELEAENELRF